MARKKKGAEVVTNPLGGLKKETIRAIVAVTCIVLALFMLLAAFELAGVVGRYTKDGLTFLLGLGYYLVPILLFMLAITLYRGTEEERRIGPLKGIASASFLIAGLAIADIISHGLGGLLGELIGAPMISLFDMWASLIMLSGVLIVALMILLDSHLIVSLPEGTLSKLAFWKREPKEPGEEEYDDAAVNEYEVDEVDEEDIEEPEDELVDEEPDTPATAPEPAPSTSDRLKGMLGLGRAQPTILEEYTPPPLSLLARDKGRPGVGDTKANANLIKRTLQNFGIRVEVDEIDVGPTVTRYALKPAEGVRISRIIGLQSNLEYALAAAPIRIEAPIPGKSLVGIEVPNKSTSTISLHSLLGSPDFTESNKPLLITLGRDITGNPVYADIAKMPHGLIAGTTGSGKSVTIHSIVTSLIYRNSPQNLRFIMVDPKRVELTLYNNIPHLQTPVITKPKEAILALKWAIGEMERRLNVLETEQVRDIGSYHQNVLAPALKEYERKRRKREAEGDEGEQEVDELPETLPYIVIIIDELSDLMSAYPRELEAAIVRLAQMSRAAGIHLLLATQSPRVNVITGLIKANIPTRIALNVNSQIDSRTILDTGGAEKLLGKGDTLYMSGESSKPKRLQAPYITEMEVKKIVAYLVKQGLGSLSTSQIDFSELESGGNGIFAGSLEGDDSSEGDEKLGEAKHAVMQAGKASTSYLQRKLGVGYSRAAKLIDLLEAQGVIGPADGSKPREVLIKPGEEIEQKEYTDEEDDYRA